MRENWKSLVAKYADGRSICNCGCAYLTPCGIGYVNGERRTDIPACENGCSANQLSCREEIATRVMTDLHLKPE